VRLIVRILMLAHRIPYPPHTGDKVRAYHVARHLARRHEVILGCLVDDPADWPGVEVLRRELGAVDVAFLSKTRRLLRGIGTLAAGGALTVGYFASGELRARVRERLRSGIDLVYVSASSVAPYVGGYSGAPIVMDYVDIDSDKFTQYGARSRGPVGLLYRLEGRRLQHYEGEIARRAALCLLATVAEERLLRSFAPWAKSAVMPNGVDLDEHKPIEMEAPTPTLMFTGAMDYRPNIDAVEHFCADIFPLVRQAVPDARFLIVGLNPSPGVVALGRLPGVTVTGAVPDTRPYYEESSVAIAPLRIARGVQNKVLQAMALGRPVVATSRACVGIEAEADRDLLVADDPAEFARRVVGLLRDRELSRRIGSAGRAYVEARHSWRASLEKLDELLAPIIGGARQPVGAPRA
jgi:sugar transferase (PEP-CTERM/EpsH1 system associated)